MISNNRNVWLLFAVCCVVATYMNDVVALRRTRSSRSTLSPRSARSARSTRSSGSTGSTGSFGGSTGFRGRVTRLGLDYASHVAVGMLMKQLPNATIPDVCDQMGSMTTVLSNVTLKDFRRPALRVDLIPNSSTSSAGLKVTFSGLDPVIECNMQMIYDWGLFTTQRQLFVTITTSNLTLTLEVLVGTDSDGNAVPGRISCNMEGDVRMASGAETGTLGGVFDFMTSTLNQKMKTLIFDQACSNITALVNDSIHAQLTAANMSRIILDDDYFLDLTFTEPMKATETYIEASHVAKLHLRKERFSYSYLTEEQLKEAKLHLRNDSAQDTRKFSDLVIPAFAEYTSKMTYAFVTADALNAAWSAALRSKKLIYTVKSNKTDLPGAMRRFLTTGCLKRSQGCLRDVFPQLPVFNARNHMELDLEVTESTKPVFSFRGRSIFVRIQGIVGFFSSKKNKSRDPLFSTALVISGQVNFFAKEERIFFNVTDISLSADITRVHLQNSSSNTNSNFQTHIRTVNRRFLKPYLKKLGSTGFPIPSHPWVKVTSPVIIDSPTENVLILGTDFAINVEAFP